MSRVIVAGLGNPGTRYAWTRHNLGFLILEHYLARQKGTLDFVENGLRLARFTMVGREVLCAEPQLYMNESGPPLAGLLAREVVPARDLLVVHDDLDLEPGRLQMKRGGGSGGHRGLESVSDALGTAGFARLRVGIGRPPEGSSVIDFVLAPILPAENTEIEAQIQRGADAIAVWAEFGTESAMNIVNVRGKAP